MGKLVALLVPLVAIVLMFRINSIFSGRSLKGKSKPLRNDEVDVALHRLADAAGVEHVRVRVLEEEVVNGLVTPGGDIYVTRGLLDQYRRGSISLAEFTSVIAHEMGHLAHGHTKRRIWDVAGAQIITVLLGGILARLIPFIGIYIARFLGSLFVSTLSRKDEFEADRYATALMIRAGFGAEPQARMLEKLIQLVPGADRAANSWLASHPPVTERAAAIRHNASRWQAA
ncbi:MAG: M48 family metallopeptidase [Pseudomonadota bacterium]